MRFPSDFLDEIRTRLPISTVIGQRVVFDPQKSKPSRGDFWCCCPFHGEKTPSFHCDDHKGRYYCFGCGVSGDIFTFLCELDGLRFSESVERLADFAGMKLPVSDPQSHKRQMEKADLYDVMKIAMDFFQYSLHDKGGAQARRYLDERGVTPKLAERFRIGFAPIRRTALKEALSARGISIKQMEDCGLLKVNEDGTTSYDRFRNRIMFPIEDLRGRVVAFGGRALEKDTQAKYLNSSETVLFHKGNMLYNAAAARKNSRLVGDKKNHSLLVVEGYMDVITLTKAGFERVVAPLGTALTEAQIALLWQIGSDPIFCFDGDEAGLKAAFRVAERVLPLLKVGVSVRFVLLPQGKDPDEIICAGGAQLFASFLQKSISLIELLWWRATYGKDFETPEARAALEKQLKQQIFTINDADIRRYYFQDIKKRLFDFFRPFFLKKKDTGQYDQNRKNRIFKDQSFSMLANSNIIRDSSHSVPLREAVILLILAYYPELWYENFEVLAALELQNTQLVSLHQSMLEVLGSQQLHNKETMIAFLEERGQKTLLERMKNLVQNVGMRTVFAGAPIEDARAVLKQAIYLHLQEYHLHKRLQDIEEQLVENPNNEIFNLLREIKIELEQTQATEALIEGFGSGFGEEIDENKQD
ncbi:DNA primase [Bartonella quintana]|uniref:DNA primase n=2 Tax=Bartonella quintana TaxID=803 RepID=W3TYT4_BARQI|nr:DNA primase [Bartonella quintana]ETS13312.1 DNA primase [Bartonella quintana BQ2-D70]ETS14031.1 DNA primase [Bartonella quintana JK 73rel]ETS15718.1 DNA primase [Bartonella quintana JK 73]ETS17721.1 DNA primase [Bartonella quintana JK 7]ETS18550.1 DNA primase [Bartonella quintana JK 12]